MPRGTDRDRSDEGRPSAASAPRRALARASVAAVALLVGVACGARGRDTARDAGIALLDLEGREVEVLGARTDPPRARVFLFTRSDCPISNRYAPEVQRIADEYGPRGVEVRLVYPDPEATGESIRAHLEEYGYELEALRDPELALADRCGASVTPEAAVFDATGTMVYRGRIDDRFPAYGQARLEAAHRDLEDVLAALVEGRSPEPRTTEAVGCLIEDLR